MKILISNDDGIHAPGIRMLAKTLSNNKQNEVYVVAPDRERSATSHGLTLHKPLRVEQVELEGDVKAAYSTTGTPSDCVKFGVTELLGITPDVVLSGINSGPNLGSEILYSGTVAAAMEGAFLNIPSIAISLCPTHETRRFYDVVAEFIAKFLQLFPQIHLPMRSLLNVNVPSLPLSQIRGVAITELGIRLYNDYFEKRVDPRGRVYYWLAGHALEEGESENSDAWAISNSMISITPVVFNMTDRQSISLLNKVTGLNALIGGSKAAKPLPQNC